MSEDEREIGQTPPSAASHTERPATSATPRTGRLAVLHINGKGVIVSVLMLTTLFLATTVTFLKLVPATDEDGNTRLHWAAREGHTMIARLFIQAGTDVNAKNNDSLTPLHLAAWRGRTETAQTLLQAGANVNAKEKDAGTPVYIARSEARSKINQSF